ncbi:MAG: 50S ribosome-binding GTPase [Candidatus Aenigmarchaeota archaeon]|nr:50S ribosome-binding GTPase [Candidatus Aenigmarchaeota archaeon]
MKSDILVIVLDARFIRETVNSEIIAKIRKQNKPYFYAVTKTDLEDNIDKSIIPKPYVLVSATKHTGKSNLRQRILIIGERKYGKNRSLKVGILGYPNVGKSSIINMLKGRKSASTSIISGHTKSEQNIRTERRILLVDTPGVIPYGERDRLKHLLIGSTDFDRVEDPVDALEGVMKEYPGAIEEYFGVGPEDDRSETIEKIALKMHLLKKGGLPDVQRAARMVIREFQKGKLRL